MAFLSRSLANSRSLLSNALLDFSRATPRAAYHEKVTENQSINFKTFGTKLNVFQVIDHYENPRNVGSLNKSDEDVGTGLVGAPACGDVMKLQVRNSMEHSR